MYNSIVIYIYIYILSSMCVCVVLLKNLLSMSFVSLRSSFSSVYIYIYVNVARSLRLGDDQTSQHPRHFTNDRQRIAASFFSTTYFALTRTRKIFVPL